MSYDVHITRAEDWVDSASTPITEQAWRRLVDADATLSVSPRDSFVRLVDGVEQTVHAFVWSTHPSGEPITLWIVDGEVVSKEPDQATLRKLLDIARALDARVVGDEGERYDVNDDGEITLDGQVLPSTPVPPSALRSFGAFTVLIVAVAIVLWLVAR